MTEPTPTFSPMSATLQKQIEERTAEYEEEQVILKQQMAAAKAKEEQSASIKQARADLKAMEAKHAALVSTIATAARDLGIHSTEEPEGYDPDKEY